MGEPQERHKYKFMQEVKQTEQYKKLLKHLSKYKPSSMSYHYALYDLYSYYVDECLKSEEFDKLRESYDKEYYQNFVDYKTLALGDKNMFNVNK